MMQTGRLIPIQKNNLTSLSRLAVRVYCLRLAALLAYFFELVLSCVHHGRIATAANEKMLGMVRPSEKQSADRSSGGCGARDFLLAYRQVQQRRCGGQRHIGIPHPAVIAECADGPAAEPGAEKAADLV